MDTKQTLDQTTNNDGETYSGVRKTSSIVTDPATGTNVRQTNTQIWSGRNSGREIIWLCAGIVLAFLALDFILHAAGATSVGFAAVIFGVGSALAVPFSGILKTASSGGNVVIWADVIAMVVYAIMAGIVAKIVTIASAHNHSYNA